jgi:hypothetical protein
MFIINCATMVGCGFYGIHVYRVLRQAEYHDLKWFFRRNQTHLKKANRKPPLNMNAGSRRPGGERGGLVVEGDQRTNPDFLRWHPGWPQRGSQN